jgi:phage tail sheath gpL-like
MTAPNIVFTRSPSIKIPVVVNLAGLVAADNTLFLLGKVSVAGGAKAAGTITQINNYGDPALAATECDGYFGAGSELGEMVVAAIKGVLYSNLETKLFPPIKVIALANNSTSAGLAAVLANLLALPMPYIALPYESTDAVAMTAIQNHLTAINGNDRGPNGQFGSFGFMAVQDDTSTAAPTGVSASSQAICIPWLRDTATVKANKSANLSAAYAAICASLSVPFLPLNGITVGGIIPPVSSVDWHTAGDTGTVALGLDSGLSPLLVNGSKVEISRSITTVRTVTGISDVAYYDLQDWQVLYYLRKNVYNIAAQPRYKRAKASIQKLQALKSELIQVCKSMEDLEMLQHVSKLADQFTVERSLLNRHASLYRVPANIIPGFHNKGIELDAGTQFDVVVS